VGTAESLDSPAEHFDVVVSSLAMHHLPNELQVGVPEETNRVINVASNIASTMISAPSDASMM
jgi:2-polyprenyl-3-methyl-5-hydroxy-6-metoxy-1,4-benzoquinol methylase